MLPCAIMEKRANLVSLTGIEPVYVQPQIWLAITI